MHSSMTFLTLLLAVSCGSISSTSKDGGQGGSPGTGGATGGSSCEQIQAAYEAALATARACSVDGTNQCQKTAESALGCSGCPTFVNDDSGLSQFDNEWNQAGCNQNQVCPGIACLAPKAATCKASDAGHATCVDSLVATPAN